MDCGWWPWVHLCLLDWCSSQPVSTQSGQKFCAEVSDLCCLEVRACRLRLPSRFYPRSSISAADWPPEPVRLVGAPEGSPSKVGRCRSEEHTSELQSLRHLVCRLLLEKKSTLQMLTHF